MLTIFSHRFSKSTIAFDSALVHEMATIISHNLSVIAYNDLSQGWSAKKARCIGGGSVSSNYVISNYYVKEHQMIVT